MQKVLALALVAGLAPAAEAQLVVEDFETFAFSSTPAQNVGQPLDENTVVAFQGPGLVLDGCVYSDLVGGLGIYLYGAGHFGISDDGVGSALSSATLHLAYDSPVFDVVLRLTTTSGSPETATVTAYGSSGTVVATHAGVSLPSPSQPATVVFSSSIGIAHIRVVGSANPWSPILEHHEFGSTGPKLVLLGTCGQGGSGVQASRMSANGLVGFAVGLSIAGSVVPAGPCGSIAIGLGQPYLVVGSAVADAAGVVTVTRPNGIPAFACGWHIQAIDLASCTLTNTLLL